MGIAIFTKSRLIPRRDAIYRVRQSNKSRPPIKPNRVRQINMNVANHGNADAINPHCGRDKSHYGRDKSRPYNAANGATARSKMPLT